MLCLKCLLLTLLDHYLTLLFAYYIELYYHYNYPIKQKYYHCEIIIILLVSQGGFVRERCKLMGIAIILFLLD